MDAQPDAEPEDTPPPPPPTAGSIMSQPSGPALDGSPAMPAPRGSA